MRLGRDLVQLREHPHRVVLHARALLGRRVHHPPAEHVGRDVERRHALDALHHDERRSEPTRVGLGVRHLGRGNIRVLAHELHARLLQSEVVLGEHRIDLGERLDARDVVLDVPVLVAEIEQHRLARHAVAGRARLAHREPRRDLGARPLGEPRRELFRIPPPRRVEFDRLVAHRCSLSCRGSQTTTGMGRVVFFWYPA